MTKYEFLKESLSKEELTKLLWKENKTYREIEKILGYNQRDISKLAKEYAIPKNHKAISKNKNLYHLKTWSEKEVLEIIDLYKTKFVSSWEIGKIFNASHSVILDVLRSNNIQIRDAHDLKNYESRKVEFNDNHSLDSAGYKLVTSCSKMQREHRYCYEKYYNVKLTDKDHIHHIDFDKTNNSKENLYRFKSNLEHCAYHGFIISHGYIAPKDFENDIMPKIFQYRSYEFLYNEYVINNKSISQINKDIDNFISRLIISKLLKKYNLFEKGKNVNQYTNSATNI